VYCSISGYGPTGPWSELPGYDVVIAGTHGLMSITGSPDAPAKVGVAMTDIVTGTLAQGAILAALYDRQVHPEKAGQRVDCELCAFFHMVKAFINLLCNSLSSEFDGVSACVSVNCGIWSIKCGIWHTPART